MGGRSYGSCSFCRLHSSSKRRHHGYASYYVHVIHHSRGHTHECSVGNTLCTSLCVNCRLCRPISSAPSCCALTIPMPYTVHHKPRLNGLCIVLYLMAGGGEDGSFMHSPRAFFAQNEGYAAITILSSCAWAGKTWVISRGLFLGSSIANLCLEAMCCRRKRAGRSALHVACSMFRSGVDYVYLSQSNNREHVLSTTYNRVRPCVLLY